MRLWNIISETSRHHVSHTTHLSLSQHISLGSTASICEPMYILSDSLPMWATKSLYEPANRYVSLQISMWATKSPREPPNLYVSLQISTWATKSLFEPPHRYVSQQIFWSQVCWLQNVRTWASMLSQAVLGLYRVLWSAMHFANRYATITRAANFTVAYIPHGQFPCHHYTCGEFYCRIYSPWTVPLLFIGSFFPGLSHVFILHWID